MFHLSSFHIYKYINRFQIHLTKVKYKSWFQILVAMKTIDADWSISSLVLDMAEDTFWGSVVCVGVCARATLGGGLSFAGIVSVLLTFHWYRQLHQS